MEEFNNVQRLSDSCNDIYWIVYQTINLINNKIYIGVHKTTDPYGFDGYLGNGVYIHSPKSYIYGKTKFECAVKKYGVTNFKRTTLKVFTNEEDAYAEEQRLVNEDFLARSDVYNMILGGKIPYIKKGTKTVFQYDLEGNYIKSFPSFQEAAKEINRNDTGISEACSFNFSCGGYYWSMKKLEHLDLSQYHTIIKNIPLYMYSIDGKYLKEFSSTRATGYTQASQAAILGMLVDNKYYFCYVKADSYDKARDIYVKSRKIYQYDSNGKFLKEWNYLDAIKTFKEENINMAIRHKRLTQSGYYWGLQQYPIYNKPIVKASKKIGKYNIDGSLVKIYNNSAACYAENGKGVYKNLVGIRKIFKGFVYKYIS